MTGKAKKQAVSILVFASLFVGVIQRTEWTEQGKSMAPIWNCDSSNLLASRYPMRGRTPDFFSRSKGGKATRRA